MDMEFPDDWLMEEDIGDEATTTGTAEEATAGKKTEVEAAAFWIDEDPTEEAAEELEDENIDPEIVEELEGPEDSEAKADAEIAVVVDGEEEDEFAALEATACIRLAEIVKRAMATTKPSDAPLNKLVNQVTNSTSGKNAAAGKGKGAVHSISSNGKGGCVGTSGKGQAVVEKAPQAAAIAKRVVALNHKGFWEQGKGINAGALTALRTIEQSIADKILKTIEERGATVRNPSAFIQAQAQRLGTSSQETPTQGSKGVGTKPVGTSSVAGKSFGCKGKGRPGAGVKGPVSQSEGATATAGNKGLKRPLAQAAAAPPAKQRIVDNSSSGANAEGGKTQTNSNSATNEQQSSTVKIPAMVAVKLQKMKLEGIKIFGPAVRALAAIEPQDAVKLLDSLSKKGKMKITPTQWILDALQDKAPVVMEIITAKAPVAKLPATHMPAIKVPAIKAPVTKAPAAKAPVVKAGVAKAPVAKSPGGASPALEGIGKPPVPRDGLEFEQLSVQSKLLSLNEQSIWKGPHPLDDATLTALLRIEAGAAHEILDDAAEEEGSKLEDPSAYVRRMVTVEIKRIK